MDTRTGTGKALDMPANLSTLMNLTQNHPLIADGDQESFLENLYSWAEREMAPAESDSFRSLITQSSLLASFATGERFVSFAFQDPEDSSLIKKLTIRFLQDSASEDVLCVCSLSESSPSDPEVQVLPEEQSGALLTAISQSYDAVCRFSLRRGIISSSCILHDRPGFFPVHDAEKVDYNSWLKQCSSSRILGPWQTEYETRFSMERLQEESEKEYGMISYAFESSLGTMRQDVFFCRLENDIQCMIGILNIQSHGENGISLKTAIGDHSAEDLEIEMSFERKELQKKSRRHSFICFILALALGVFCSPLLDNYLPYAQSIKGYIFGAEETERNDTEPSKEEEEIEIGSEAIIIRVPRESSLTFTAETYESGTSRTVDSDTDYNTETLTMSIDDVLSPDYYGKKYGRYLLDGTEAGISFTLSFSKIADEDITIVPQTAFQIYLAGANDERTDDYQLMDKEFAGSYSVSLKDGQKKTFYKRYNYDEAMQYLVVIYYEGGVRHEAWFSLRYDDPNVDHDDLQKGNSGIMVQILKQKLSDLGYEVGVINRSFDARTEAAVKAAQKDLGMEETGIATSEFQKKLYAQTAGEGIE